MSRSAPSPGTAPSTGWLARRERVGAHFSQGAERWTTLTSDAPVSGIRATVRAGRRAMRDTLLSWLPRDLSGERILDAGCGTGVFSLALAARGAHVVGVDLSSELVAAARERTAAAYAPTPAPVPPDGPGDAAKAAFAVSTAGPPPEFIAGDLFEVARRGDFTRAVVMDCFIHYEMPETLEALEALARAAPRGVLFTVAPWTPLLALMHLTGRLFRGEDKAPPIVPVKDRVLRRGLSGAAGLGGWELRRTHTVHSGFYISRGVELRPTDAGSTP